MSDTYKDMKHNLDKDRMTKRKSWGYEYWGRDAPRGSNGKTIRKNRRLKRKYDERLAEIEHIEQSRLAASGEKYDGVTGYFIPESKLYGLVSSNELEDME